MVFESVSLIHHHVVPLDVIQDGGILQDQLIGCDQHLQHLPAPRCQDTNPSRRLGSGLFGLSRKMVSDRQNQQGKLQLADCQRLWAGMQRRPYPFGGAPHAASSVAPLWAMKQLHYSKGLHCSDIGTKLTPPEEQRYEDETSRSGRQRCCTSGLH